MAKKNTMIGNMMGTMVALPLMRASATMVNGMPAGMGKDLAGTAVGLQGVAMVGHSMGAIPNMSFGGKSYHKSKRSTKKRR
jgi:hypothetical protein